MNLFVAAAFLAAAIGCGADAGAPPADGEHDGFGVSGKADGPGALAAAEVAGVLAVANQAARETLDHEVGLDGRAADGIVARRAASGPFTTLAALDAVPWVGPVALEKLLAHAHAHGFVEEGPPAPGCLIISEYFEGWGNYNKAIELYNCGGAPLALGDFRLCLVRNDDVVCTITVDLGDATLLPGAVTTVCRQKAHHPAGNDPVPLLAQRCALERAGAMTFSGDDRLLILRADGSVADSLGRVGYRPPPATWADVLLHRCDFTPADGVSFYATEDYFVAPPSRDLRSYGEPPVPGCP